MQRTWKVALRSLAKLENYRQAGRASDIVTCLVMPQSCHRGNHSQSGHQHHKEYRSLIFATEEAGERGGLALWLGILR
jgi:hypothetical protein